MKKNYYVLFIISLAFSSAFFATNVSASTLNIATPFSFTRNLYGGSKGNDVRKLQILLNEDIKTTTVAFGEAGSSGNETDFYGNSTFKAVKIFQKLHNLPEVGYVGPSTRKVLNEILANGGLQDVERPTISSVTATKGDKANSEVIRVNYDGNGEIPTIWFAYGAAIDAVTLNSTSTQGKDIKGSAMITISELSSDDYFVKAFVKNSYGTTTSTVIKFNGATGI